ncbi:MAG: hypothetical protein QOD55_1467 [Solirubrobacteraceae bacterium]|nr:hypothetical protein [Solirubrobacteraceae bacterium]
MADTPLVPGPLYGLRAWTVVGGRGRERLAGPQRGTPWPAGGAWLHATCERAPGHAAPAHGCACGVHGWHPSPATARRVLAGRGDVAGVVEARGAVEVHCDGFRAARARPYALVVTPGRNARLIARLAEAHGAQVAEVGGPDELVGWCRERALGLTPAVVSRLIGPEEAEAWRRARRRKARSDALRLAAALVIVALVLVLAFSLFGDAPDGRVFGRTGEVRP